MHSRDGSSRGSHPGHHQAVDPSTTDRTTVARQRVNAVDRRCCIARLAEQVMPLATYYGPRPLRAVPLGQLLVEGWWAA